MLKKFLWSILLTISFSGLMTSSNFAQSGDFISGTGIEQDWSIEISGVVGEIELDGELWEIQFFQETGGLNGYARTLSFLGRRTENFIRVNLSTYSSGTQFLAHVYDYKNSTLESSFFEGEYNIGALTPSVELMENYIPEGKIPDYRGRDFSLQSDVADYGPSGGTITYNGSEILVFPVHFIEVSDTWYEFWSVGIDPQSGRTYQIISYLSERSWVIDLWSGTVESVALGGADDEENDVEIVRDENLEDFLQQ